MKDLIIYLKTTDSCNLNCSHCYSGGNSPSKNFLNAEKTVEFLEKFYKKFNYFDVVNVSLHGGEPMLYPIDLMKKLKDDVIRVFDGKAVMSIQSNLTYNLTEEKIDFLMQDDIGIGTSWDYQMRWKNEKQESLWEKNVKELISRGKSMGVIVSLNKDVLELDPEKLMQRFIDIGFSSVNFERITPAGNAKINLDIYPDPKKLDEWTYKLWLASIKNNFFSKIENLFFQSLLTTVVYNTFSGCRSRSCSSKIFTLNASGTIAGCPNTIGDTIYGTIYDEPEKIMFSTARLCSISCESTLPEICSNCDLLDVCNGDCFQINWKEECYSPKMVMRDIKNRSKDELLSYLNGYIGNEGIKDNSNIELKKNNFLGGLND